MENDPKIDANQASVHKNWQRWSEAPLFDRQRNSQNALQVDDYEIRNKINLENIAKTAKLPLIQVFHVYSMYSRHVLVWKNNGSWRL